MGKGGERMDEQMAGKIGAEAREVKTCPACGGTWPAARRHCIARGASLEGIPTRMVEEGPLQKSQIGAGWMLYRRTAANAKRRLV